MTVFAGAAPLEGQAAAGGTAVFIVSITNASDLVDRYSIETLGVEDECVRTEPESIALFPGESGEVAVTVRPPPDHPAMSRSLAFNVRSGNEASDFCLAHAHLVVGGSTEPSLAIDPNVVSGGRSAEFSLVVGNDGNVPFDAVPTAVDPENLADFVFDPPRASVPPGGSAVIAATVRGGRAWFGPTRPRTFSFGVVGDPSLAVPGVFLQRPRVGRWVISLLGLLLAAAVFGFVMSLTVERAVDEAAGVSADQVEKAFDSDDADARRVPVNPGFLEGQLTSSFGESGLGGIQAEAFLEGDYSQPVGSGVTDDAGNYEIGGLALVLHRVRFSGAGFDSVWYPGTPNPVDAESLMPAIDDDASGPEGLQSAEGGERGSVIIAGRPGSIAGVVAQGDPVGATATLVETVQSSGAEVATIAVSADGSFLFEGVPAPNTYELTIQQEGFAIERRTIRLGAAEALDGVEILLQPAEGLVTGSIEDIAGVPLGGATITATDGAQVTSTVSYTEPRAGTSRGDFVLRGLPIPGRYAITVEADGYRSETRSVLLSDDETERDDFDFALTAAAGSITGVASLDDRGPSGGITVTAVGPDVELSTTSVSASDGRGSFVIDPVAVPGVYTVTFSRDGYTSDVQLVELDGPLATVSSTLTTATGTIGGVVVQTADLGDSCAGINGVRCVTEADVLISDGGQNRYDVRSADDPAGQFEVSNIPPGSYTVRANLAGADDAVQLVSLGPAEELRAGTPGGLILRLGVPAEITLEVVDAAGLPVPNVDVRLIPIAEFPGGTTVVKRACTDAQGAASFSDIDGDQTFQIAVYRAASDPIGEPLDSAQVTSVTSAVVRTPRALELVPEAGQEVVPCR